MLDVSGCLGSGMVEGGLDRCSVSEIAIKLRGLIFRVADMAFINKGLSSLRSARTYLLDRS